MQPRSEVAVTDSNKQTGLPLPEALAGNFQEAARWFNQLWAVGSDPASAMRGGPIPSMMMPTMDVKELEKRIADLRSVETWLELNLGLLRTTIQGLELQRGTILAWQGMGAAASGAAPATGEAPAPGAQNAGFQPALWWNALQQQFAQMAASAVAQDATPAPPAKPQGGSGGKAASSKPKTAGS